MSLLSLNITQMQKFSITLVSVLPGQCVTWSVCYLVELGEQGVQTWQLPAEVDVSVEACRVVQSVWVRDLLQETLHAAPLTLHEIVHEQHVLLLCAEPVAKRKQTGKRTT